VIWLKRKASQSRANQRGHAIRRDQQISSLERMFKSCSFERSKKKFPPHARRPDALRFQQQIIQTYESLHSKLQELKGHYIRHDSRGDHLQHRPARFAAVYQKVF